MLLIALSSSLAPLGVTGQVVVQSCCEQNPGMCSGTCVDDYDELGYNYACHCSLSPGAVVGIVIGVVAVVLLCVILCRRRYQRQQILLAQRPLLTGAPPMYAVASYDAPGYAATPAPNKYSMPGTKQRY